MITTLAIYAGAIFGACTIAVVTIIIRADREQPADQATDHAPTQPCTALVKQEHAPTQPVFVGMPQRRPDYRETAIREYADYGIRACITYVHAFDDAGNGWGTDA